MRAAWGELLMVDGARLTRPFAAPLALAMLLSLVLVHAGPAQAQTACGGFQGFNLGFNFGAGGFQGGFQGFNFGAGGFQGGFQGFNFGQGGLNFNGGLTGFGFNFGGQPGCNAGVFGLIPDAATVSPGQTFALRLVWVVPTTWHDLEYLDIRIRSGNRSTIVRWLQGTDTYTLIDGNSGQQLGSGQPGESRELVSDILEIDLKGTYSENSGATGQAVGVNVEFGLKDELAGREVLVDVGAKLDAGTPEAYEKAAVLNVVGQADANNDDEKGRKPTAEERQQRERTNRASLDDYRTEGNAVGSACEDSIPTITIANRDGQVVLRLHHDAKLACEIVRPGDYVEAVGEKQHEQLYDVDQLTVRRNGARVR
jgi:hypothetical protein